MKAAVAVRAATDFRGLTAPSSGLVVHGDCRFPRRWQPGSRPLSAEAALVAIASAWSPAVDRGPELAAATGRAPWANVLRDKAMHEEGGGVDSPFSFAVPGVPTAVSHEATATEMDGHADGRAAGAQQADQRGRVETQVGSRSPASPPSGLPDPTAAAHAPPSPHRPRASPVREAHQHGSSRTARRMSSSLGLAYTVVVSTLLCLACLCTRRMSRVAR